MWQPQRCILYKFKPNIFVQFLKKRLKIEKEEYNKTANRVEYFKTWMNV